MITSDAVTAVANYLGINVFQLFIQAYEWQDEGVNDEAVKMAYNVFVAEQLVPDFVFEYCETIAESMG